MSSVSIHALRFQRAMPIASNGSFHSRQFQSTPSVSRGRCSLQSARVGLPRCFNPRPPFPEGDATPFGTSVTTCESFNPRPPFPEGDAVCNSRMPRRTCRFQSTPSVSRGRCARRAAARLRDDGFNPRPPFPEGDAEGENAMCRLYEVSIHALRFQRAMLRDRSLGRKIDEFQSTPSVSRGRCQCPGTT